ncbi:MAG: ATP synthase subunit I [Nitrospirae bacterium]|nr:ATP synthase subunit I [Nitrospirota bacterium]
MQGITSRVYKQALIILGPLCLVSLFFAEWRFPFSMAVGGLVGVGNLGGLAWSVTALLSAGKAQAKMIFLSIFKLLIIFSILIILAALKLINVWGLLGGFTVVVVLILKEGFIAAREESREKAGEDS